MLYWLSKLACCELCFLPASTSGFLCEPCEASLQIDIVLVPSVPFVDFSFCSYCLEPPLSRYLLQLKDRHRLQALPKLAWLLQQRLPHPLPVSLDALVYIPSSVRKLLSRGFNPAEALASEAAQALNLPVWSQALYKVGGEDQRQLTRKQRFLNMRDSFRINQRYDFVGKKLLIVEDVLTTGATASAAARTLKNAGAQWVGVWALAHTVFQRP